MNNLLDRAVLKQSVENLTQYRLENSELYDLMYHYPLFPTEKKCGLISYFYQIGMRQIQVQPISIASLGLELA